MRIVLDEIERGLVVFSIGRRDGRKGRIWKYPALCTRGVCGLHRKRVWRTDHVVWRELDELSLPLNDSQGLWERQKKGRGTAGRE